MARREFVPQSVYGSEAYARGQERINKRINIRPKREITGFSVDAEKLKIPDNPIGRVSRDLRKRKIEEVVVPPIKVIEPIFETIPDSERMEILEPLPDNFVAVSEARKKIKRIKALGETEMQLKKIDEDQINLRKSIRVTDDPVERRIQESKLQELSMIESNRRIGYAEEKKFLRLREKFGSLLRMIKNSVKSQKGLGENKAFSDDLMEAEEEKLGDHELAGFKGKIKARMPKIGSVKSELPFKARNENVLKNVGTHLGMKHGLYSVDATGDRARRDHTRDYKGPAYAKHKRGAVVDRRDSIGGGVEDLSVPLINE